MTKKIIWLLVSCLMAVSLLVASCGPTAEEEEEEEVITGEEEEEEEEKEEEVVKPGVEVPKYGGLIRLVRTMEPTIFDPLRAFVGGLGIMNPGLWTGDWAKGPAGGYGTDESSWGAIYQSDHFGLKTGFIAESVTWTVDAEKNEGTILYKIRRGVHFALNPDSEASSLVGGREVTADDVVYALTEATQNSEMDLYVRSPVLHDAVITKVGPWEVTVKLPLDALIVGISRLSGCLPIVPPEVVDKYGDMTDWRNSVGAGPFMLTQYVPGSMLEYKRNDNFWMKDPVGPGKGNQLPYLDGFKDIIILDRSTMLAAFRTAKVDRIYQLDWEEAAEMRKSVPELIESESGHGKVSGTASAFYMNVNYEPFSDVRVRQALSMAIDFETIRQNLGGGLGRIITFPYFPGAKEYGPLYFTLEDEDLPEAVRELYTYNPDKAKQLLAEAGYPEGFSTEVILPSSPSKVVDYYSVIADMWSKVGINLSLNVMEPGAVNSVARGKTHKALIVAGGQGPTSIFYTSPSLQGDSLSNSSCIDDPVINEGLAEVRLAALTDINQAMQIHRELNKYILEQAYVISTPSSPMYNFWWPWLKNYSGEDAIGYRDQQLWTTWVWLDQDLKESMGY